jgi:DNA-binding SARP family transcriptional activator
MQNSARCARKPDVRITVLGPVGATVQGESARLGGRRPRALLAALLVADGDLVPEEQLIDAVWEDRLPAKPRQALQTYVADLRRALEPDRRARQEPTVLLRHPAGYALAVGPERVDTRRFVDLVAAGVAAATAARPAEALAQVDQALRLWRGPAYADLADSRFLRPEIGRLEECRSLAREIRVAARLGLGEHRQALLESQELTVDHPLRESGWALRVLALYRCGRQAEALQTLGTARRVLREQLGADPGPELARLAERVLVHDPALAWNC